MFTYDFDYSWGLSWGHLLVGISGVLLAALGWHLRWRRGLVVLLGAVAGWGILGAIAMHHAVQIASPQRLVTRSFLAEGQGHVLELGAGSGRATVGLLLARPRARVTAVDAYRGYFGIDDNTPERLIGNARAAGVDDRVRVQVADMRTLPFDVDSFDAAYSVAAIDHLRWDDIAQTLRETARVLKPGGQLLIVNLNRDAWITLAMPWAVHGHGYWGSSQNRQQWQDVLERSGFTQIETGTAPATVYFLARSSEPLAATRPSRVAR